MLLFASSGIALCLSHIFQGTPQPLREEIWLITGARGQHRRVLFHQKI